MNHNGLVLFSVLMVMAVMMLLSLSLMQATALYVKASGQLVQKQYAIMHLESAAALVRLSDDRLLASRSCTIPPLPDESIMVALKQHRGCLLTAFKHRYVYSIQDLGVFPCLYLSSKQAVFSSHHWLVTMVDGEAPEEGLQLRYATKSPLIPCDGTVVTTITEGLLSWRRLRAG
jgi:hypothetical protein